MTDPADIRTTLSSYCDSFNARDRQRWVELFTDDANQEDPVGDPVNVGHEAIGAFFDQIGVFGTVTISQTQPAIVTDHEAIMFLSADTDMGGSKIQVPLIIDHVVFTDDARISSLRSFWDKESIATIPA